MYLKFIDSTWPRHISFSISHEGNIDTNVKIVTQVRLIILWQSRLWIHTFYALEVIKENGQELKMWKENSMMLYVKQTMNISEKVLVNPLNSNPEW